MGTMVARRAHARGGPDQLVAGGVGIFAYGLRSAYVAGLRVIAVPHPRYPPEPGALAHASLMLPSLAGLTADTVSALAPS